ncbi:TPA: hypothetical protein DDW35_06345 [Candidatus Sumerlaeota bacterium]|jgi:hypothetical protein|nr:hypothetical protein [Candidatus Sumerlaeota bacterium]
MLRLQILSGAPEIREKAIGMLVELLRKGIGREVLSEMLDSGLPELEEEALHQICNLPQEARPPVLEKCLDNKSKSFRLEALQLMRDLNGPDVNSLFVKAIQDPEPEVLTAVTDLFSSCSDQPLQKAAAAGLKSPNEGIRTAALGYLHDTRAWLSLEVLIQQGLNSSYPDVVHGSADALRVLTQADVNSDNYSDWAKWYKENGRKWAVDNDPTFGTVAASTLPALPPGYGKK